MKFKTKQKEIMQNWSHVLKVGYCEMTYLLYDKEPVAYTSGKYGWNADVYDLGKWAIVTGYRPSGNVEVKNHAFLRLCEKAAENTCRNNRLPYDEKVETLDSLRRKLINGIKEGDRK